MFTISGIAMRIELVPSPRSAPSLGMPSLRRLRFVRAILARVTPKLSADRARRTTEGPRDRTNPKSLHLQSGNRHAFLRAKLPVRLSFFHRNTLPGRPCRRPQTRMNAGCEG
jgi:hypothetical protein